MRRIAVINQKGGVGKTTTTANLGAALARAGKRVLLIDLDPQAHLSLHFGVELSDDQPSVYDVLTTGTAIDAVAHTIANGCTLVPADIDLAGAEAELVGVTGREVLLREAVDATNGAYDALLIDCPPSLGVLTVNALVAAHELLIPLQAQFFALQGLGKLLNTVSLVKRRINPVLHVGGVVLCMHESATRLAGEVVEDLKSFIHDARGTDVPWADARIYDTCIRRNVKLAEACSFGQSIFDYAPRSNGALDYASLATEVFSDLGLAPQEPPASANGKAAPARVSNMEKATGEPSETSGTVETTPTDRISVGSDSSDAMPEPPASTDPPPVRAPTAPPPPQTAPVDAPSHRLPDTVPTPT